MSWHSKWHNIKHKKAASDAAKSKVYTKIAKLIEIAARWWADPKLNPTLDTVLIKARANNLPKDVIDRAVKKWSWQAWWENLEEIFYEWYGPGWTAIYIKVITSNKNRASANVRTILGKLGCNMWEPWSVSWQFKETGTIFVTWKCQKVMEKWKEIEKISPLDMTELEEDILELDAKDYETFEDGIRIYTEKTGFTNILKELEKKYKVTEADIEFIPENYVNLSDDDAGKLERVIEMLEDDDDVDSVFHNAE